MRLLAAALASLFVIFTGRVSARPFHQIRSPARGSDDPGQLLSGS